MNLTKKSLVKSTGVVNNQVKTDYFMFGETVTPSKVAIASESAILTAFYCKATRFPF